ncbi:MAG: glutathione S-transferase family protein [Alphaproteobacteria bacterium]
MNSNLGNFKLYNALQSTCSQRVRYTLHYKNLSFSMEILDLFSGDQLKPEYLKINPNGVVPAIDHDGKIIIDSSVIIEYLEDIDPDLNSLRPKDPELCANMRAMIRYFDEVAGPSVRIPSYNMAFLPHFQSMTEQEFIAVAESKPLRKEFLLKMGRTGFSEKDMNESTSKIKSTADRMDNWIEKSSGPYLLGKNISYADICIMPVLVRMQDLGMPDLWEGNKRVSEWFELIQSSETYKQTYCQGALLSQVYSHLSKY